MPKPLLKWLVGTLLSVSTNYNHYSKYRGGKPPLLSVKCKMLSVKFRCAYGTDIYRALCAHINFPLFTFHFSFYIKNPNDSINANTAKIMITGLVKNHL